MKYIIYLIVLFSFNPFYTFAADDQGEYLVMGIGSQTCAAYLHDREAGSAYFLAWLTGYLSAYNLSKEDTYHALGSKKVRDVQQWLTAYCTINRDVPFEEAVRTMLKRFHASRIRSYSER